MSKREYQNYNILDDAMENELIEEEQEHKNEDVKLLIEKKTQVKVELNKKEIHNLNQQEIEEIQIKPVNEKEIDEIKEKDNQKEIIIQGMNKSNDQLYAQEESKKQKAPSMEETEKANGIQEERIKQKANQTVEDTIEQKGNRAEAESIEHEDRKKQEVKQEDEVLTQRQDNAEEKKETHKQKDKEIVAFLTKREDGNKSEREKTLIHENFFSKEGQRRNDGIPEYKKYYQQKERSGFVKWFLMLAKISIIVMLLPFIAVIGAGVLGIILGFLCTIGMALVAGVFILGAICFMSSQISISIIALGISIAITCLAFGGIVLILFVALMRWSLRVVRKYRKPRINTKNKEIN